MGPQTLNPGSKTLIKDGCSWPCSSQRACPSAASFWPFDQLPKRSLPRRLAVEWLESQLEGKQVAEPKSRLAAAVVDALTQLPPGAKSGPEGHEGVLHGKV